MKDNINISSYKGEIYSSAIQYIYTNHNYANLENEFGDWEKHFTYIHGKFDTQRKIDIVKLENTFDITLGDSQNNLFCLVYCLETYYSIILRILAYKSLFGEDTFCINIFDNDTYKAKGISNYTCVNYYNWFLKIPNIEKLLTKLYKIVSLSTIDCDGDAISTIFECIFPKEIRHSLGEYYTPYWLADIVIDTLTDNDPNAFAKKYIDPSCGSATFIVALINKFKQKSKNTIFFNVCGIDINPLTVLAAKTNYLLLYCAEFELLNNNINLEIPIYCADTIAINDVSTLMFDETNNYDAVPKIKYDYIVGNPPWVNWEYLPDSYRINHAQLWQYYGLFTQKGLNANFIKEDISVLLTYVSIDNYLMLGGKIGFIVKETLFKSIKQGEGFRKFVIAPKNIKLKVLRVDDLTQIKPFKDAVTRTAIIYIEKGTNTHYPIDYVVWKPTTNVKSLERTQSFDVKDFVRFDTLKARPSINGILNSGWITESDDESKSSKFILGNNNLVARTGVFTGGANGIYWLKIDSLHENNVIVSNITDHAKNKMKNIQQEIEKEFVFPFLTGNDLDFWAYSYSKYILCPHTSETKMYPINEKVLAKYPLTAKYFTTFKKELEARKGFTSMDKSIHDQYYYTLQRIGTYTFAKYKVCWRYISKNFTPAVVEYADDPTLGNKNIIGNEKIISIGVENKEEAYYICGVISSTPYRKTIENYMVGTQITPSIIGRLNIPKFDPQNKQHLKISQVCQDGHKSNGSKITFVEQIDKIIQTWIS
ncbi:MAG: N-6 DNA methylase [Bacteroidales bacterium]|nr:N-6 DNA methylase [Bacteroidales bacterium]